MLAFLFFLLCIRVVHLILKSANLIFVIMLNEITHQFLRLSCKGGTYFACAFVTKGYFIL